MKHSSSTPAREVFLARRDFHGRTVVITGGAGTIGRALARSFGGAGAKIAVFDLPSSPLNEAQKELQSAGIEAIAVPCDITDTGQVQTAMNTVRGAFGSIDVLINNAGIVHRSAFADTLPDVFRRVMEVNLFGALHCTQACMDDLLAARGLIIAVSSIALRKLRCRSRGSGRRCVDGLSVVRRVRLGSIDAWRRRQASHPGALQGRATGECRRCRCGSSQGRADRTPTPRAHPGWKNQRGPVAPGAGRLREADDSKPALRARRNVTAASLNCEVLPTL
ncbi:MAG: SDR family NAD(P)-dependent oxidoreductase [Deltaproteobacteria bacterium]|nr:SDR family NAD(P)-dependent oxidoreductase [Deltaproteobacteria bacterium]